MLRPGPRRSWRGKPTAKAYLRTVARAKPVSRSPPPFFCALMRIERHSRPVLLPRACAVALMHGRAF